MSAYKKLNRQDVFVSDYTARKSWQASGSLVDGYGIQVLRALSDSISPQQYPNDTFRGEHQTLLHSSINHLYYADSTGSTFYGSRDLAAQSTLTLEGTRQLGEYAAIFSIPRDVYGTHIQPNTFTLSPDLKGSSSLYLEDQYVTDHITGKNEYIENIASLFGGTFVGDEDYLISESAYVDETTEGQYIDIDMDQQRPEIIDDGEGALIFSGSELYYTKPREVIGDIIYNQGQVIITKQGVGSSYIPYISPYIAWKSNQPIYTYNVHCKVKDSELNFTYNPSAVTGSNGQLQSNVTGDSFTPYITTVGLYNDANELIAVAKTGRPIPKTKNTDMTFVIKLDL